MLYQYKRGTPVSAKLGSGLCIAIASNQERVSDLLMQQENIDVNLGVIKIMLLASQIINSPPICL